MRFGSKPILTGCIFSLSFRCSYATISSNLGSFYAVVGRRAYLYTWNRIVKALHLCSYLIIVYLMWLPFSYLLRFLGKMIKEELAVHKYDKKQEDQRPKDKVKTDYACLLQTIHKVIDSVAVPLLRLHGLLVETSGLLLLVHLLHTLLVLGSSLASLLHRRLLLRQTSTLVAQSTVGHQTLDLGSLVVLVSVVLEHTAHHELAHVVLLRQTEQLADVACSLRTQTTGLRGRLVRQTRNLLLALLHDHQVQHANVRTHDAAAHRLSLSLSSAASAVARTAVRQQKAHTVIAQNTLLHGEALLVVSSRNATSTNPTTAYRKM